MSIQLRQYQRESLDALYAWFLANPTGNPLLVLPTGAGKSLLIAALIREALESWPSTRILMATHVKELIQQNAQRLISVWPEAPIGIHSAGLKKKDVYHPVIFAGIQSVWKKAWHMGAFDLILIDEVHLVSHKAEGTYRHFLTECRKINPNVRIIGLTATPFRTGHGSLMHGEDPLFHGVAHQVKMLDLIAQGYLSPLVSKRMATTLDVSGVQIKQGEYAAGQLERAVDRDDITQAALDECIEYGADRKKWLVFCSGVAHAEHVAEAINARGIAAGCVTGKTPTHERDRLIEQFRRGQLRALTNANVLCLDEETEILTSDGFIGIDDMTPDHLVAGWKKDETIEFEKPKMIVRRFRDVDEKMVTLSGDHTPFIRVTENHRMVLRNGGNRAKIKVIPAIDLQNVASPAIPTCGIADPFDIDIPLEEEKTRKKINARIASLAWVYRQRGAERDESLRLAKEFANMRDGMSVKKPSDLILEECELIGFWLGDGTKACGRVALAQSLVYQDVVDRVDTLLEITGIHAHRAIYPPSKKSVHSSVRWTLARGTGGLGQSVARGYFEIEPYLNKEGTYLYWGMSVDQFKRLLHGFWLADGNHHTKNNESQRRIQGTQYKLYSLLQAICSARGISARISRPMKKRNPDHGTQWKFTWDEKRTWNYRSKKHLTIESEYKEERVWCVTSSTSYLICRRGGKVFVIGNTTGFDVPDTDMLVMLRPTQSPGLFVQMVGRGSRIAPEKESCLVLDFAGNTMRHGPVDQIEAWTPRPSDGAGEAPSKACPDCETIVATAVRVCPECGYAFPFEEKHHAAHASDAPILSTDFAPRLERHEVARVEYDYWPGRDGRTPTLKVTYYGPYMRIASEWVCFEHVGFARNKAVGWWAIRAPASTIPSTIDEAEQRAPAELRIPSAIIIDTKLKYPEITGYEWGEKEQRNAA